MERHDLHHEFPELNDKIHELKTNNSHFRSLFDKYNEMEHQIHRINSGQEVAIDEFVHELKAKMLFLKDEIYALLIK